MTITYQWEIMNLHPIKSLNGLNNVIGAITWIYRGTNEDGIDGFVDGKLVLEQPEGENFINYEDITQENIISWLESNIDVESHKPNIINQISENINGTPYQLPLPWAKVV